MLAEVDERIRRRIAAIHEDHRSGSVAITRKAAEALALLAGQEARSAAMVEAACRLLVAAQPHMASLMNLANAVLLSLDEIGGWENWRTRLEAEVAGFLEWMETGSRSISRIAAGLVRDGMTVMTHSSSETVRRALLQAHGAGRRLKVVATESRPLYEGVALAKGLGEAGIPVNLIADAAMMPMLPQADLVLVGADAVTISSLVNKAGTALLALGAKHHKKRFYVLAGPEKFVPLQYNLPVEMLKPPAEVLGHPLTNVTVRNLYFDRTPLKWITALITADGFLAPAALQQRLGTLPLHPALL